MHLVLVVSDCPPAGDSDPVDAPALPALSTILRLGQRRAEPGGWRALLSRQFAPPFARDLPPGAIAAAALPAASAGDAWLATPVHLLATPVHLRLPSGGLLVLEDAQCHAFAEDFARVFEGSGHRLHPLHGRFVLTGLAAEPAGPDDGDPAAWLGSRLEARARGGAARRRLASEIELWLHDHRLNAERVARGRAPVSALWLWGGGTAPDLRGRVVAGSIAPMYGEDAFVDGLAALTGGVAQAPPSAPDWATLSGAGQVLVQLSLAGEGGLARRLASIEERWLGPALDSLRAGRLASLDFAMASTSSRLTRGGFARFWRRQPWWEYLRG